MKGAGRGYIIIYACACEEVDKLTYHLPPTGYSYSQEEEKGPPIRIIKGIIGIKTAKRPVVHLQNKM